jgi:hypothetical protein
MTGGLFRQTMSDDVKTSGQRMASKGRLEPEQTFNGLSSTQTATSSLTPIYFPHQPMSPVPVTTHPRSRAPARDM